MTRALPTPPSALRARALLFLGALGLLHFALAGSVALRSTVTLDEVGHLPAGISYLERGTFRMYRLNPPLARLPAALAALSAAPRVRYEGTWNQDPPSHWLFGLGFLAVNDPATIRSAFTRARLTLVLWSVVTIPVLYLWGGSWFGAPAGALAATLWTLCPNLIAHAGLVTTDLAATSAAVVAAYFFSRWLERPTMTRAVVAGIVLGLAQLTKYSLLSLWLVFPLWSVWEWRGGAWRRAPSAADSPPRTGSRALQAAVGLVLALVTINAGYLFQGSFTPLDRFAFHSQALTRPRRPDDPAPAPTPHQMHADLDQSRVNLFQGTWLGRFPLPLPRDYVLGFDEQKLESEGWYQMYLLGRFAPERSEVGPGERRGWWWYYLYGLALKAPLSTWLLVGLGSCFAFRLPAPVRWRWGGLWLLALVPLALMSLGTDINIGVRYAMPALPFLFLIASPAAPGTGVGNAPARAAMVFALVAWNALALFRVHPHELAYFNELIGGPANGRYHLIDSNLDWGQDLRGLARFLEKRPDWQNTVRIAYMGSMAPEYEGISEYRLAPRDLRHVPAALRLPWEDPADPTTHGPQPGRFAVSANLERGLQNYVPCPIRDLPRVLAETPQALGGGTQLLYSPADAYAYFQFFQSVFDPEIGYSILLYEITKDQANRVRAEMGLEPIP